MSTSHLPREKKRKIERLTKPLQKPLLFFCFVVLGELAKHPLPNEPADSLHRAAVYADDEILLSSFNLLNNYLDEISPKEEVIKQIKAGKKVDLEEGEWELIAQFLLAVAHSAKNGFDLIDCDQSV
jgi:hypothetical protein